MSKYLSKLYVKSKYQVIKALLAILLPFFLELLRHQAKGHVKGLTVTGTLFEKLGFSYVRPIDSHNMDQLLPVLRTVKPHATGPALVHVLTQKDKVYDPAKAAANKEHASAKFDVNTDQQIKPVSNAPKYTKVFANTLIDLAKTNDKICAVTAAVPDETRLDLFAKQFGTRCFDVGIAEQHAVTLSAALAAGGMKPFCGIYSTFLQLGYDQVVHDLVLQGLLVSFAIDRARLVGANGANHAGSFDIAYLANLPSMMVMAAAHEVELVHMVAAAAAYDAGAIALRYPRGDGEGVYMPDTAQVLQIGKGRQIWTGARVAILFFGIQLGEVLKAAETFRTQGMSPTIADAQFAKPSDHAPIWQLAKTHEALIII